MKNTANIHQALNGAWHITDNSLPCLDETGSGHKSYRAAISAARAGDWTHYVSKSGKVKPL